MAPISLMRWTQALVPAARNEHAAPAPGGRGDAAEGRNAPAHRAMEGAPLPRVDSRFTQEELARFRALQEAVLEHERRERVRVVASELLDQLPGGSLDSDERRQILDASVRSWASARETSRSEPSEDASRALRAEYLADVRRVVQGSRAEAIVQKLTPALGLSPESLEDDGGDLR